MLWKWRDFYGVEGWSILVQGFETFCESYLSHSQYASLKAKCSRSRIVRYARERAGKNWKDNLQIFWLEVS